MLICAFDARSCTLCEAQELRARTQLQESLFVPNRAGVETRQYVRRLKPNAGKCRSKSYEKVVPIGLC